MDRVAILRSLGLYIPILAGFLLAFLKPRPRRIFPAALLGFVWTLPTLLALQLLNRHFGWWQFNAKGGIFRGMPVDLYIGWAVLWGILPVLAFNKTRVPSVVAIFFSIDLILMPACFPLVQLGPSWLTGELVALCFVLVPGQLFVRWTLHDTHLKARAALHVLSACGIFLFLIPEVVFAIRPGPGWTILVSGPTWLRSLALQGIVLLGVVGVSAVQEFAERGRGTPIPYDPPKKLVISGFYRYIANPMQFSCAMVMTAWGTLLRNPWVTAAGGMSFLYSLGLATWDEDDDMRVRHGKPWQDYRKNVHAWRLRLIPWHAPDRAPARLYIAESCGPCSELRDWFKSHCAIALETVAAEDHPTRDLQRITYDPMDDTEVEEGVRAFARGLEHINLGWAFVGACLRMPGISHVVQLLIDGSGLGPQRIPRRISISPSCTTDRLLSRDR